MRQKSPSSLPLKSRAPVSVASWNVHQKFAMKESGAFPLSRMITGTFTTVDNCDDHRHLLLHTTGEQQLIQENSSCNCGISTVSHDFAHESAGTAQQGHRTPDQCTALGESLWSAARDQGKRPLHHDRVVDDLAQFELCVTVSVNKSSVHHFDDERKEAPPQHVNAGTCIHCRTKHQPRSTIVASSPWAAR